MKTSALVIPLLIGIIISSCKKATVPLLPSVTDSLLQNTWTIKSENEYIVGTTQLYGSYYGSHFAYLLGPLGSITFKSNGEEIRDGFMDLLAVSSQDPDTCDYSLRNNSISEQFNHTYPIQATYLDTIHISYISNNLLVITFPGPVVIGPSVNLFTIDSLTR